MPAYGAPPTQPVTMTEQWQPTGRTRLRSWWFGIVLVEIEQSAMVQTAPPTHGDALCRWREVKRWQRARRGHVIRISADALHAFALGKSERRH